MALLTVDGLFGADVAFFDASDANTITSASGNVTQWLSKGTQVAATRNAAPYATYNATGLNGKPCFSFAGGALLNILTPTFFPTGTSDATIFALMQGASTSANQVLLKWGANGDTNHNLFGCRNGGSNVGWFTNRAVDARGNVDLNANPDLFIAEPRYSDATSAIKTYDNGTLAATTAASAPTIGTSGDAFIGTSGIDYLSTFTGNVAALGVVRRKLTDTERQKLVAILLWQWGLQANIPADNPDKAAAPTDGAGGGTSATAPGATLSTTSTLVSGTASGQKNATANGSVLTASSAFAPGSASASASGSATANGAVISVSAALAAGSASATASVTASGGTFASAALFIPGTATVASNATAAGVMLSAAPILLPGTTTAGRGASATGATFTATAAFAPGSASASVNPYPPISPDVLLSGRLLGPVTLQARLRFS